MAGVPWSLHGQVDALDTQGWASRDITPAECCSFRGRAAWREGCTQGWRMSDRSLAVLQPCAQRGHGARRPPPACAVLLVPGLLSLRGLMESESHTRKYHADAVHSPNLASGAKASRQSLTITVM